MWRRPCLSRGCLATLTSSHRDLRGTTSTSSSQVRKQISFTPLQISRYFLKLFFALYCALFSLLLYLAKITPLKPCQWLIFKVKYTKRLNIASIKLCIYLASLNISHSLSALENFAASRKHLIQHLIQNSHDWEDISDFSDFSAQLSDKFPAFENFPLNFQEMSRTFRLFRCPPPSWRLVFRPLKKIQWMSPNMFLLSISLIVNRRIRILLKNCHVIWIAKCGKRCFSAFRKNWKLILTFYSNNV